MKIWQDSQHELVNKDYKNHSIHHKDVENDVYHNIRKPMVRDKSVEFRKSILGIEDQIIVTNVPGVNMNEVYFDALCIDPLLEAYVFYHSVQKRGRTEVDLGMIETVVQRRDMMIAGETDQLSESWDAVLELWAQAGITDSVILRMSEWCDRGMLISERMAIDFRFEEPRTPL